MSNPGSTTTRGTKRTTAQRGYGAAHDRERKRWLAVVLAGRAICSRCRTPIHPNAAWDLDHSDDRTVYLGPAHRSCNRRAGAQKRHKRKVEVSRSWA